MRKLLGLVITICMIAGLFTSMPVTASAAGSEGNTILAGSGFSLVLKADGTLWSMGSNDAGQVGDGTGGADVFSPEMGWIQQESHSPVKIMSDVKSIFASGSTCYAIKSDNTLWAWGSNICGQIGDGTTITRMSPVKIMDGVSSVSANDYLVGNDRKAHVFAVKVDGSLWAWGSNDCGELGDGTIEQRLSPVKIMENVSSVCQASGMRERIGYGGNVVYVIKTDQSLWAWGNNFFGQLGLGYKTDSLTEVVAIAKVMDNVAAISANNGHAAAIKTDASLWAWGIDAYSPFMIDNNVKTVYSAGHKEFYIKDDYSLWGRDSGSAYSASKIMDNVSSMCVDTVSFFAVQTDGALWSWGNNGYGQLGNGTTNNADMPVKIMENVADVSSSMHTLSVKKDGSLWGMGSDLSGALGQGSTYWSRPTPVKIMGNVMLPTAAPAAPPAQTLAATPTNSTVLVNGKSVSFDAYTINGSNYFKLRDLAYTLSGTEKQFNVGWDGANSAISLTSGKAYTVVGGEMSGKGSGAKTPVATSSKIYLDGKEISLTAYTIDGNNYFKLRDIGEAFDFGVEWDGARNTIVIDTSKSYTVE